MNYDILGFFKIFASTTIETECLYALYAGGKHRYSVVKTFEGQVGCRLLSDFLT